MPSVKNAKREVICHYENGNVKEIRHFENEKLEGRYTSFYPDGNVMLEQSYVDGMKEGKAVSYYRNGNIREEGIFHKGKLNGEYSSYYENGQIREKRAIFRRPAGWTVYPVPEKWSGKRRRAFQKGPIRRAIQFLLPHRGAQGERPLQG